MVLRACVSLKEFEDVSAQRHIISVKYELVSKDSIIERMCEATA